MKNILLVFMLLLLAGNALAQGLWFAGGSGGASAKPGMVLPDTIYVATDCELNIYAANLSAVSPFAGSTNVTALASPGPSAFSFAFDSNSGTLRNRSFRWTPAGVDSTPALTISAYDAGGKKVESKSMVLKPIAKTTGVGKKRILFVGDSTFDDGGPLIVAEVDSLFSLNSGADILPIGTQVDNGYNHESYGGKSWNYFVTNPSGPFWKGGRLNFQQYMADAGIPGNIDLVCINLGGNNAREWSLYHGGGTMPAAAIDTGVIDLAKAFIDTMQNRLYGYPNAHIVINMMQPPSAWGSAFGSNYGGISNGMTTDWQTSMRAITKKVVDTFDGGRYNRHVDVCLGGLWVDTVLGYPTETLATSAARIADDELVGSNWLHMDPDGKDQMADALYSHLMYAHTLYSCTNQMADSHTFNNATYWYQYPTAWGQTGAQADPWGGTSATLITATSAVGAGYYLTPQDTYRPTITADDVVVSVYLKNGNLATNDKSDLRLYNTDIGTTTVIQITWTATPTVAAGAGVTHSGIINRGAGWWQIWLHKDLSQISNANKVQVNFDPCSTTPVDGNNLTVGGFQLEYGVTEPCVTYVAKP